MNIFEAFSNYLTFEKNYSNHTLKAYIGDIKQCDAFISLLNKDMLHAETSDLRAWIVQ